MVEPDFTPAMADNSTAIRLQDLSWFVLGPFQAYTPDSWSDFKRWHSLEVTAKALYCTDWLGLDEYGPVRVVKFDQEGVYVSHVDLRLLEGMQWPLWTSILEDYICLATTHMNDVSDGEVLTYYLFTHLGYRIAVWQSGDDASASTDFSPGIPRADFLRPHGRWGECLYRITPSASGRGDLPRDTCDHDISSWNIADLIVSLSDARDRGLSEIHSLNSESHHTYRFPFTSSIAPDGDGGTRITSEWTAVRGDTAKPWFTHGCRCWSPDISPSISPRLRSIELPDLRLLRFQFGYWRYFEQVQEVTYSNEAFVSEGLWISTARLKQDKPKLALMAFRIEEGIGVLQALAVPNQESDFPEEYDDLLAVDIRGIMGYRALVTIWNSVYTFDTILGAFEPMRLQVPAALLNS